MITVIFHLRPRNPWAYITCDICQKVKHKWTLSTPSVPSGDYLHVLQNALITCPVQTDGVREKITAGQYVILLYAHIYI